MCSSAWVDFASAPPDPRALAKIPVAGAAVLGYIPATVSHFVQQGICVACTLVDDIVVPRSRLLQATVAHRYHDANNGIRILTSRAVFWLTE